MFHAIEATTDDLKQQALRLRYEVFFEEGNDGRYADHERKVWSDRDDGPQSRLVVGLNELGNVVGTMRLTRLIDWPFIAHEIYDFRLLAEIVKIPEELLRATVARADRGVVAKAYRGSGVLVQMQHCFERMARDAGCSVIVGIPGVSNIASRRAFQKLGWLEYPHVSTFNGFTAQHIYKDLRMADESTNV